MKTGRGRKNRFRSVTICLYTNTPDEHLWIDRQPVLRPRLQIRQRHLRNLQRPATTGRSPFDFALFGNRFTSTPHHLG